MTKNYSDLEELAKCLRCEESDDKNLAKKFTVLYAFNGTGKTRLSTVFKNRGKQVKDDGKTTSDTLYFNAFTEDLFSWDNDIENDSKRVIKINRESRFFDGLTGVEMDNRIRPLLNRYADFDFKINPDDWEINFWRQITRGKGDDAKTERVDNIKISRGEENIFIWCFFLSAVELVTKESQDYKWVKYIYIDDPISSLDENNAIAVANHLAQLLTKLKDNIKTVVSTHHALFFNVLCHELQNKACYRLCKEQVSNSYTLHESTSKPFFSHLASLVELDKAQKTGKLYTYHFNMMRRVMEQTASFFDLDHWDKCIKVEGDNTEEALYERFINVMSHGDYSLYEPSEMMEENKNYFRKIFCEFISQHPFNSTLFSEVNEERHE